MNLKPFFLYASSLVVLTIIIFPVSPTRADNQSIEKIGNWVAIQIGFHQSYELPPIFFVDREELGEAFRRGNQKAYFRWQREYGERKAREILVEYMNDVVGLFTESALTIHVGNFIDGCGQQAVLAHELVHFFQYQDEGIIPEGAYREDILRWKRELAAYKIEDEFRRAFCEDQTSVSP
jgi:hypothetical protein